MSEYHFYGWESADVQNKNGLYPTDYYDILSKIWCAETCAPSLSVKVAPEKLKTVIRHPIRKADD